MILEALLIIYLLASIAVFVVLVRDKYIQINGAVILLYIAASILWPVTLLAYYLEILS